MDVFYDIESYPTDNSPPLVLTMGDFDGLHIGHESLIKRTIEIAQKENLASALLTFDPSPKMVLEKLPSEKRILTTLEKKKILEFYFRLNTSFFIPFTPQLARLSAKRYLKEILLDKLKVKHIVIGHDHHFGYRRRGNYRYLRLASARYGFQVQQMPPVTCENEIVSSSRVRFLLEQGEIEKANEILCLPYFVLSEVISGEKRGRILGFPTANLAIPFDKKLPLLGVYFGAVFWQKQIYKAVINVGQRPTFSGREVSVEAHILDFHEDLYGQEIFLFFIRKIRPERKFSTAVELQRQIKQDIEISSSWGIPEKLITFLNKLR